MSTDPSRDSADTHPAPSRPGAEDDDPDSSIATWLLTAAWVAVYLAMLVAQGGFRKGFASLGPGGIDPRIAHEFGAMSARDVVRGEVWRTITATFVHFSALHLICNLTVLIRLGRVLESWYGAAQFLVVYLVLGAAGNGLAVAGRYLLGGNLDTPSAGGSSVMFGFIALVAVVGWRSRTRFGDFVRRQMLGTLVVFGVVLGVLGRSVLDNFGHAGGALAGALVAFAHRPLIRTRRRRGPTIAAGVVALAVVVACIAGQWRSGRRESLRWQKALAAQEAQEKARQAKEKAQRELQRLAVTALMVHGVEQVAANYDLMAKIIEQARGPFRVDPTVPARNAIRQGLSEIDPARSSEVEVGDADRFARWRKLAEMAAARQPGAAEIREFRELSREVVREARATLRETPGAGRGPIRIEFRPPAYAPR